MEKRLRYKTKEFGFKAVREEDVDAQQFKEIKENPNTKLLSLFSTNEQKEQELSRILKSK